MLVDIARERRQRHPYIPNRQKAELVTQSSRRTTRVSHRHNRRQINLFLVPLQPPQNSVRPRPTTNHYNILLLHVI